MPSTAVDAERNAATPTFVGARPPAAMPSEMPRASSVPPDRAA
jgi:hypothetical protein